MAVYLALLIPYVSDCGLIQARPQGKGLFLL